MPHIRGPLADLIQCIKCLGIMTLMIIGLHGANDGEMIAEDYQMPPVEF